MRLQVSTEGHDVGMTPEEAADFYETDEDPEILFARFDAAPKGITVAPTRLVPAVQTQPPNYIEYSNPGLYGDLRHGLLPETSAAGSNAQQAMQR
jgi:hypothetical protein